MSTKGKPDDVMPEIEIKLISPTEDTIIKLKHVDMGKYLADVAAINELKKHSEAIHSEEYEVEYPKEWAEMNFEEWEKTIKGD